jgi:hypothetical protein
MPASSARLRKLTRQALLQSAGSSPPTHAQVADAFHALRAQLQRALNPLFGATAVETLFERSRHLAAGEFNWLPSILTKHPRNKATPVSDFTPAIAADELLTGLGAVLAHDIGLLVGLVGGDLIVPLVHKAWGIGSPSTDESD